MALRSLARFALRLVATGCITLWLLEAPSKATKCAWDFIGEIWELEQVEAPHLSTGEPADGEESKWGLAGTLEGISSEEVRIDGVLAQELELEATR